MNARLAFAGAVLSFFALACSGGGGPSLTVSPTTLTVIAGSTPAGFTATLTGSSSAITWSLSGPGTLGAMTGTTTTYTPPTSVASAMTATLTATAGGLTGIATITINPGAAGLTVSPMTLSIAAGSPASPFTATLTGPTATISWTLTGPGTLSTMTGPATNYTPPLHVASATTASLTATAGGFMASAAITITVPASISVTGSVIAVNGLPLTGVPISIGTQSAITGASGSFTLSGVTPPYDLIAISGKIGVVYQELRLTTPTIVFPNMQPSLPNSGTVSGNISPTTFIGAANYETEIAWGSPETSIFDDYNFISVNPFTVTLNWFGPSSTTGNLHVLQWVRDPTTNLPTSYAGYQAKHGVVVAASGATSGQDMTMTAVTSANLTGTVSVPTSYKLALTFISVAFADGTTLPMFIDQDGGATFSYITPSIAGAQMSALAASENTAANLLSATFMTGIAPNATGVSIVVPEAATPESPTDGGTGVTTATTFTWTPYAGGVHVVTFTPSVSTNPTYYVFTVASTTTVPDLSAQGLGLPTGGAVYNWSITGLAPFATLDAFATGNNYSSFATGIGLILFKPPVGLSTFSYSAVSPPLTFTTQ